MKLKELLTIAVSLVMQTTFISTTITEKQHLSLPPIFHLDDYDRCMMYGEEALYCVITFQLHPENPENTSETWKIVEEVSSDLRNYRHDLLRHGICVSDLFTIKNRYLLKDEQEVQRKFTEFYNEKYKHLGIGGATTKMRCESRGSPYSIDVYDILFGVFVLVYGAIIVYATLYEVIVGHKTKEEQDKISKTTLEKFICSVSIQKNWHKTKKEQDKLTRTTFGKFTSSLSIRKNWNRLMNVHIPNQDMQALSCIQGIRFYVMIWTVMIHGSFFNFSSFISNTDFVENDVIGGFKPILFDPTFGMQIFFMLTGWLMAYNFFLELERQKTVTINYLLRSVSKRYFRLTPALAFVVIFSGTWIVHLSRRPVWDDLLGDEYRRCRENWWTNLLYINNYINRERMCFTPGWYLTANMQLYILSLFVLWLMWNNQKKIPLILGSILVAQAITLFFVIYLNDFNHSLRLLPKKFNAEYLLNCQQHHALYTSLPPNVSGMVAGLAYGYVFYKYKNQKLFTKRVYVILWWIVSWGLILGLPLITTDPHQNPILNAIFGSLWRSVFAFAAGMVVFGMTQGQGWLMKWACQASPIYILGRLTYSAYLVHTLLQGVRIGMKRAPTFISTNAFLFEVVGDIRIGFLGALFLTLFIEMPMSELYKWFTKKKEEIGLHNKNKFN